MSVEFHLSDWERAETGWLLSYLSRYLDTMEAALEDTARLEHSTLQITRQEYDDEVQWDEVWREHCRHFEDEFPTKLRYSFLILLYGYLERRTKSFCDALLRRGVVTGPPFKKLRKFTFLASVQEYFRRYQPLADATLPHWPLLFDSERLRNCIVHAGGIIADDHDPNRITAIIGRTDGISRGDDGEVRVELLYCKNLIVAVKHFFNTCFDTAGFCPKHDYIREIPDT